MELIGYRGTEYTGHSVMGGRGMGVTAYWGTGYRVISYRRTGYKSMRYRSILDIEE